MIGNRPNTEFARSISVREGTVRSWLSGGSLPAAEALAEIRRVHGYSIDWILTGDGSQKTDEARRPPVSVGVQRLQISASAGPGTYVDGGRELDLVEMPRHLLDELSVRAQDARILTASGISMLPTIGDGDWMLANVAKERRTPIDGMIYVFTIDDALFVKRLRRSSNGWIMVSDNQSLYPPEPIDPRRTVKIHGQIVWVGRKL